MIDTVLMGILQRSYGLSTRCGAIWAHSHQLTIALALAAGVY